MDNKKKYTVLAGIVAAVLVMIVVRGLFSDFLKSKDGNQTNENMATGDADYTEEKDDIATNSNEQELNQENELSDDLGESELSDDVESDAVLPDAVSTENTDSSSDTESDASTQAQVTENTDKVTPSPTAAPVLEQEIVNKGILLPYAIPETTLVIEQINPYKGVFLEDGKDQKIDNVAAIVVRNTGEQCVEYMNITLNQANRKLAFVGSALEPHGRMVIMEANAAPYEEGDYSSATADVAYSKDMEMSEALVKVEEAKSEGLVITNISNQEIPCVRVFYKFYMDDVDVYVGGITYNAKIVNLKAGESQTVIPSHYVKKSSKVVMVKTYDSAQ